MVYFRRPFTQSGTRNPVPFDSQPDGSVSYQQGYTERYEQDPTTVGTARRIERDLMNGLFYEITLEIQRYQQSTWPVFIETTDNEGVPFAYAKNVIVERTVAADRRVYISRVDANTTAPTPGISGDWVEFDTVFTSGGGGEGGINWFVNGNFETGDSGWTILDGTLSLETGVPLQGSQSLNATVDVASADFFFRGTINQPDLVYRTRLHGLEGVIVAPDTISEDQYQVALVDAADNTKVIGNTRRSLKPGKNVLDGITFVPADVVPALRVDVVDGKTATLSDVFTCDIFVATPDGQGYVQDFPIYDENDVTVTSIASNFNVLSLRLKPYREGNKILLEMALSATRDSGTNGQLTVPGISFTHDNEPGYMNEPAIGTNIATQVGGGVIDFFSSAALSETKLNGVFEIDSWPTWATKGDGGIKLLDSGTISEPFKFEASDSSQTSNSGTLTYEPDTSSVPLENDTDLPIPLNGKYIISFAGRMTNVDQVILYREPAAGGGFSVLRDGIAANNRFQLNTEEVLQAGDKIQVRINTSTSGQPFSVDQWSISKLPDGQANAAIGANTSLAANENSQFVLMEYMEIPLDTSGSGDLINGEWLLIKDGSKISLFAKTDIDHANLTSAVSAAGVVPEPLRPPATRSNTYWSSSGGFNANVRVTNAGAIVLSYPSAQNNSTYAPWLSWIL